LVNSTYGGDVGRKLCDSVKEKISLKLKEYFKNNTHNNTGKHFILTEEHKKKISDSVKGEMNGFYGKKHTVENKIKFKNKSTKYKQFT
jgi:hypothetical protein